MSSTAAGLRPAATRGADAPSVADVAACAAAGADWIWTADEGLTVLAWHPLNEAAAQSLPEGRSVGVDLKALATDGMCRGGRIRDVRVVLRDVTGARRVLRLDGARRPASDGAAWRGVASDVTECSDASEATRLRELLQAVFDAQDSAICVYDAELRLVAYNPKILEYQPHLREILPLEGRRFADILAFHRAKGVVSDAEADAIARRVRDLGAGPVEPATSVWNGRTYAFHDYPLPSGGFVGVRIDVTETLARERELKQARDHAMAASRAKSEFLANMSHELRTPLNAVIGFSELVLSAPFGPISNARYEGYVRDIRNSGKLLLDLISDLLDMARIEAGKREVAMERFELCALVEDAVKIAAVEAGRRGVALRAPAAATVEVTADRRATLQILLNLLSNAVKFTPVGGTVDATVAASDEGVEVRVADTGPGVPAEVLDRLGEPFLRAARGPLANAPGTGLGLAISRALAEMQCGRLEIANAPAGGAVVRLILQGAKGSGEGR